MKLTRVRLWMTVVSMMLMGGPVAAQALDIPVVTPVQSKPGSVRLMVGAGSSGAPAGFLVERMTKLDYDAVGGFDAPAANVVRSSFTGVPTFNIEGSADAYVLAAGQSIEVEIGQLFDETGVSATSVEELAPATEYVIRVRANGAAGSDPSAFTEVMSVSSSPLAANCTHTIGWYKTHENEWDVPGGLFVGTTNYSKADLLLILDEPAAGNKLLILCHQLIVAKLNVLSGADPSAAAATIALADALIGGLVPLPLGGDNLPAEPATSYANLLDDYNNGLIGPGHCGTTPASLTTWGKMKAIYHD
jgi:hypothetical protein